MSFLLWFHKPKDLTFLTIFEQESILELHKEGKMIPQTVSSQQLRKEIGYRRGDDFKLRSFERF